MNGSERASKAYKMLTLQTKDYKHFTLNDKNTNEVIISFDDYRKANKCFVGDEVEWHGNNCKLVKRAQHTNLVGVLDMTSKYLYGHTKRGHKIYLFHPMNKSYPSMRVGSSEDDPTTNRLALVQFSEWEDSEHMPRANLIRFLGACGDKSAEIEALKWNYGCPQLTKIQFEIPVSEIMSANKECPLIEGTTINIDPEGCKDIDDVITINKVTENEYEVIVSIADVASFIQEDSVGDLIARQKGETLYQNGVAMIPMIPSQFSEGSLSLLTGEERLAISLYSRWNTEKKELTLDGFKETRLMNNKTYSYETIQSATDFPVRILADVASFLKKTPTEDSHEWIEELMILYNKEVAKCLLEAKAGLLRQHSAPDAEKYEMYAKIHEDLKIFAYKSAEYKETAPGLVHAGLGSIPYTHASSPLRRYADLYNQRILKLVLQNKLIPNPIPSLANQLNHLQKLHKRYERDLFFLEQILKNAIGRKKAIVLEDTNTKIKAYVFSWKRIISIPKRESFTLLPGEEVYVEYYSDMKQPGWKERMVFSLRKTN